MPQANLIIDEIKNNLTIAFAPTLIEIVDNSNMHAEHYDIDYPLTHIYIKIASDIFQNKPKVAVHRMIYAHLDEYIKLGLHAIQIEAS